MLDLLYPIFWYPVTRGGIFDVPFVDCGAILPQFLQVVFMAAEILRDVECALDFFLGFPILLFNLDFLLMRIGQPYNLSRNVWIWFALETVQHSVLLRHTTR